MALSVGANKRLTKKNLKGNIGNMKHREITLPAFKIYCKAIATKTVWYWLKDRCMNQWKRVDSPEINYTCMGN